MKKLSFTTRRNTRSCKNCKYFSLDDNYKNGWGACKRWTYSYQHHPKLRLKPDEIQVEIDEGWGAMMGPDFGCVLFEKADKGD